MLKCTCNGCGNRTISIFEKSKSKGSKVVTCTQCGSESFISSLVWGLSIFVIWLVAPVLFLMSLYVISNFYIALIVWLIVTLMMYAGVFYFIPMKLKNDENSGVIENEKNI